LSPQASGGGEEWGHTYTLDNVECVGVTPCRVGSGCEVRSLWTWAHHRPALDESVRRASGLVQLQSVQGNAQPCGPPDAAP